MVGTVLLDGCGGSSSSSDLVLVPNDWEFMSGGDYRLAIDTALEDLAGNSIAKPFEVDIFRPVEQIKAHVVELKFSIR